MNANLLFSIVTPSCNSECYIAETIESVINQKGDFSIEYIIVDNCSTDSTVEIIKSYQKDLQSGSRPLNCNSVKLIYISEKDSGMYEAINKGFSQAKGDIYAWINSDDIYLNGCFSVIEKIFIEFSAVRWVKGITSYINKDSTVYKTGKCYLYSREWIKKGLYGPVLYFIQQDSVFWRRDLWEEAGGLNSDLKFAGDYNLWGRYARYSALYTVCAYLSCFRKVKNQKSENMEEYWQEIPNIDSIKSSNKSLIKEIAREETKSNIACLGKVFRPAFHETFHLIRVNSEGTLELYDGPYEMLQKYL